MSVTIDADVLLNATDTSSRYHRPALDLMHTLAAGPDEVYLFWPVAVTYARIATDGRVFEEPLTEDQVKDNLGATGVKLTAEELRAVDALNPPGELCRDRGLGPVPR